MDTNETTPTPFEAAIERLSQIKQMIANGTLIEKEDYGKIPGGNKPTLLKPGAQKLMAAFNLASAVRDVKRESRLVETGNTSKEVVSYQVIVSLQNKLSGMPEGEGVGSCNSGERKYAKNSAADVDNTILKMARKRALVDAVLDATGAGSLFTQDIEDMDLEAPRQSTPQRPPQASAPAVPADEIRRVEEMRIAAVDMGYTFPNGNVPGPLPAGISRVQLDKAAAAFSAHIDKMSEQEYAKRTAADDAAKAAEELFEAVPA